MRILLTGGTGFLGSYLLERLILEKHEVIVLKRSFSNTWRIDHLLDKAIYYDIDDVGLEKPFKEHDIDVIINTVASQGKGSELISNIIKTNIFLPIQLLEYSIKYKIKTFINTDTLLHAEINQYALSKYQFTEWIKYFVQDIQIINVSLELLYGPKDESIKFIPWLIHEILEGNNRIKLTKGEQKRDFLFIDDVVNAYMIILKKKDDMNSYEEFEIVSGKEMAVKDFVNKVYQELKVQRNIQAQLDFGAVPYRNNEQMEVTANNDRIVALGWKPIVTPIEGIKNTVKQILKDVI